MTDVAARLARIRERIADAAARSGRPAAAVTLVGASKTVSADRVEEAFRAGLMDFGENRVQELLAKKQAIAPLAPRWHFIGRLQRNKVRKIVGEVVLIHSVDRVALAHAVNDAAAARSMTADVLIEVNATGEPTKAGVRLGGNEGPFLDEIAEQVSALPSIRLAGLMTLGKAGDERATRLAFASAREAAERLGVPVLSMGMSGDMEIAIEEGATLVRVGTALFGDRPTHGEQDRDAR